MHHDLDTPLQVEEWRFDRRQPAGVDCPPQLQPGKAADAQPGLHLHSGRTEDELQPAPRLADKLAWRNTTGWAIGIGLLAAIAVLAMTRISEFLYFQF